MRVLYQDGTYPLSSVFVFPKFFLALKSLGQETKYRVPDDEALHISLTDKCLLHQYVWLTVYQKLLCQLDIVAGWLTSCYTSRQDFISQQCEHEQAGGG